MLFNERLDFELERDFWVFVCLMILLVEILRSGVFRFVPLEDFKNVLKDPMCSQIILCPSLLTFAKNEN